MLGTVLGWRYAFGLVIPFAVATLLLTLRLASMPRAPRAEFDGVGAVLAAVAVGLLMLGVDNLGSWGAVLAAPSAPFSLLGLSPALAMVGAGVIGAQLFVAWVAHRRRRGRSPLLAPEVIESPRERAAVVAMVAMVALGSALTFLVPLYIQIVQGRSSFDTAIAMIPFQLSVFVSAIVVVGLSDQLTARQIARAALLLVAFALILLGVVMNNEWNDALVVAGLVMFGLGRGALLPLLFNVLVTAAPKRFAGDVGSLRGTVNSLSAGVGTAIAGALVVGLLGLYVQRDLEDNPAVPRDLVNQVDVDRAHFISNARLKDVMAGTTATPEQIDAAVRINTEARLRALKLSFLLLAGVALLVIVPAGRLPDFRGGAKDAPPS